MQARRAHNISLEGHNSVHNEQKQKQRDKARNLKRIYRTCENGYCCMLEVLGILKEDLLICTRNNKRGMESSLGFKPDL